MTYDLRHDLLPQYLTHPATHILPHTHTHTHKHMHGPSVWSCLTCKSLVVKRGRSTRPTCSSMVPTDSVGLSRASYCPMCSSGRPQSRQSARSRLRRASSQLTRAAKQSAASTKAAPRILRSTQDRSVDPGPAAWSLLRALPPRRCP